MLIFAKIAYLPPGTRSVTIGLPEAIEPDGLKVANTSLAAWLVCRGSSGQIAGLSFFAENAIKPDRRDLGEPKGELRVQPTRVDFAREGNLGIAAQLFY